MEPAIEGLERRQHMRKEYGRPLELRTQLGIIAVILRFTTSTVSYLFISSLSPDDLSRVYGISLG